MIVPKRVHVATCVVYMVFLQGSTSQITHPNITHISKQFLTSIHEITVQNQGTRCSCLIVHDIQFVRSTDSSLISLHSILTSLCQPAGVFIVNFTTASSSSNAQSNFGAVSSFTRVMDVGKNRPACTLGVIYISQGSSFDILPPLFTFLRHVNGIVKTNQDQFVFIAHSNAMGDQMLTSRNFGARFKFAVAVILNTYRDKSSIVIRYLCNKCSDHYRIRETSTFKYTMISDKTTNLHGKVLKVSTPTSTRWLNEMHTTAQNKWLPKRGIYATVLNQLMRKYNFTAAFFPSTGGGTGSRVNKTIWVGTVGDVLYGKADLGHVTAETLSRSLFVDSTFAISYEWLTFTTGKAPEYHTWQTIYWPFTPLVWQLTAVTSVLVIVLFKVTLKITNQHKYAQIGTIVEYMLAVLTEEGVKAPEQHPTHSLRVTIVLWLLFGLLMGTAYRSKLTAFLAFPHIESLPQSFEDLAESKYSFGLQYIKGAAFQILKTSKNPTYVSIFKRMDLEESDVKCFKRTITKKFACISWDSIADYVYHKNLTDKYGQAPVVKSPAATCFITAGIIMEKQSIFKASFDRFLIWAMDTGMMSKWRQLDHRYVVLQRKHWERETSQPEIDYTPSKSEALTLAHVSGSYYLFFVGISASLLAFTVEMTFYQHKKCMGWDKLAV